MSSEPFPYNFPDATAVKDDPIARLIAIVKGEVGYREGYSHGHWNNHNKYASDPAMHDLAWSQNQPWCAVFDSWAVDKAGLKDYYPRTASVPAIYQWARDRKQWSEYPAVGALVVIGNKAHTGVVIDYDNDYITTVEGNTNDNGSAEGNGVYLRRRLRRSASVLGYAYPKIPGVTLRSADPNYKPPAKQTTYTTRAGDRVVSGGNGWPLLPGQVLKVQV